ncbi:MAG TPA: complex I subunit 1 family protein [Candidatus Krumholzibacteriaceae bacterium]|jgi:NADH-quinone oxidoreductase subunit H|nr:complex I subunit 1 family protein [Candidatus Krumholzibacteriaceae bacterium]
MTTAEVFLSILQVLIFPGVLFLLTLAFFYEWINRKFLARLQNRYGPLYTGLWGILQPFADFLKLLSKEDIMPITADTILFSLAPIFYSALPLTAMFIIPVVGQTGLIAFEGDLIFVLFLFTLIVVTIFLSGWCSMTRFSVIGGIRAALQMLGYEIPMALAIVGPAITAKSLSISGIVEWQQSNMIWNVLLQPLGFAILVVCLLAELGYVPFDIPEAETEIVAGWQTEYSGRKLALFRLGKDLELVFVSALLVSLYLGGPQQMWIVPSIVTFLIKTIAVVLLLTLLRAVFARFRIDQMISGMWNYLLPLAILQMVLIQLGFGGSPL